MFINKFWHLTTVLPYEKIVSGIYALWSLYALLYVLLFMSRTLLSPFFEILFYPFYLSLFPSWFALAFHIPISLGFVIFFGTLATALFYPLASYYLWHSSMRTVVLAIAASLLTATLDTYAYLAESRSPLLALGIGFNLIIAYLLWRSRVNLLKAQRLTAQNT